MPNKQSDTCCDMRLKVAIGIAKVYSEEECGVSDATLVDFHDFDYTSRSGLPVEAALSTRFCPWCGTKRTPDSTRRTVEVIQPRRTS